MQARQEVTIDHQGASQAAAKAERIVARRFRYADRAQYTSVERHVLEQMRTIAVADAEVMLLLNMEAYSEERAVLSTLPMVHTAALNTFTPESFVQGRVHIVPMPGVLARLTDYVRDESDSPEVLEEIIRHDIVLSLSLLRLVNSPLFAGESGGRISVGSVREAVEIVGSRQLASLALGAAQMNSVSHISSDLSLTDFWHHSLMTACLARSLARHAGFAEPEQFFTAGLLHDVGRLLLVDRLGRSIVSVYGEASVQGIPFHVAEKRALGFDHGAVGAAALRSWGIDERLVAAVQEHHSQNPAMDHPEFAAVVIVADFMARALGYSYWTDTHVRPPAVSVWEQLGISWQILPEVAHEGYEELERARHIFDTPVLPRAKQAA